MTGFRAVFGKWQRFAARGRWNRKRAFRALGRAGPGRSVGAIGVDDETSVWTRSINGWAWSPRDTITAVHLYVDGSLHVALVRGLRSDVARARGAAALHSGWSVEVDLRSFEGQRITLDAHAITTSGLVEWIARRTTSIVARDEVVLVEPADDDVVASGFCNVRGIALALEPIVRVDCFVNGEPVGPARLFAEPTPGFSPSSLPGSPMAAFSSLVDLRRFRPGASVVLGAIATDASGTTYEVAPVRVGISARSVAGFDSAAVDRIGASIGRLPVRGASTEREVRLVMVTHDLGLGGGQLYLSELVRQLRSRTEWPMLVISQYGGVLRDALAEMGVDVHLTGEFPLKDPVAYESKVLELAAVAHDFGANTILSNTMIAAVGADVASRLGLPSVLAIHESYGFDEFFAVGYGVEGAHPAVRDRIHGALRSAAAVVFEADATRRLYEVEGDPQHFLTIRYGVPIAEIDEYVKATDPAVLRRRYGLPADASVILCMGTIEPRKSQASLVTVFAELATHHPDAVLVLVGDRDDAYSAALRTVVDRLDLGDRIRLIPIVEDTRPWYRMADLLVSASDLESMPRSILEAMAFGLPVVAARAFGVGEIIEDGVTGWLVDVRDSMSLRDGLDRVLGLSPRERREVADAAAMVVREEHDSSGYGAAFERLLGGLAVDPGALPGDLLGDLPAATPTA